MKAFLLPIIHLTVVMLFGINQNVSAKQDIELKWAGLFMEKFKMELLIESSSNGLTGRINMYDGQQMIQNDIIVDIILSDSALSFYIPAKSTSFKGRLSQHQIQLSGSFIFPDDSHHPVQLRQESETSAIRLNREQAVLNHEQMQRDIEFLAGKIDELHPDPYYYITRENYNTNLDHLLSELPDNMSLTDFYLTIWPLASSIKCSHTGLRLPQNLEREYHAEKNYMPIRTFFTETGAYLIGENQNHSVIDTGAEIQAINDIPIAELRQQIRPLLSTEGNNPTAAMYQLNRSFYEYLALITEPDTFRITAGTRDRAGTQFLAIPAKTHEEAESMWIPALSSNGAEYGFKKLHEMNAGLLQIPSFAPRDMDEYFSFLDRTFSAINNDQIKNLIIDLRDNGGGHPIFAAQLLSYLVSDDFTYFDDEHIMEELLPLYQKMSPSPKHFQGQIYVITNGGCLSTTGHFISLLRYHTTAQFIGEAPGSHFYCNDFSQQFTLPESGIQVNIPQVPFKTRVEGMTRDSVFFIDHPTPLTLQAIMNDQDPALLKISGLIQAEQL